MMKKKKTAPQSMRTLAKSLNELFAIAEDDNLHLKEDADGGTEAYRVRGLSVGGRAFASRVTFERTPDRKCVEVKYVTGSFWLDPSTSDNGCEYSFSYNDKQCDVVPLHQSDFSAFLAMAFGVHDAAVLFDADGPMLAKEPLTNPCEVFAAVMGAKLFLDIDDDTSTDDDTTDDDDMPELHDDDDNTTVPISKSACPHRGSCTYHDSEPATAKSSAGGSPTGIPGLICNTPLAKAAVAAAAAIETAATAATAAAIKAQAEADYFSITGKEIGTCVEMVKAKAEAEARLEFNARLESAKADAKAKVEVLAKADRLASIGVPPKTMDTPYIGQTFEPVTGEPLRSMYTRATVVFVSPGMVLADVSIGNGGKFNYDCTALMYPSTDGSAWYMAMPPDSIADYLELTGTDVSTRVRMVEVHYIRKRSIAESCIGATFCGKGSHDTVVKAVIVGNHAKGYIYKDWKKVCEFTTRVGTTRGSLGVCVENGCITDMCIPSAAYNADGPLGRSAKISS